MTSKEETFLLPEWKGHTMRHALVVGCSGIIGHNLTRYMLLNHDWKVTGLAKKEFPHCPKGLDVLYCDLQNNESIKSCCSDAAERFKGITHLFFVAWVPGQNPEQEVEINTKLFENVLQMVKDCPKLEYILLHTGTRYYGISLGDYGSPFREDQQRIEAPIYYYNQEDLLKKYCEERKGLRYSIARPPCVVGFTLDNVMNFGTSLAIYAVIMKELGEPLIFPGSEKAFNSLREFVDVGLLCRFLLWQQSHEFTNKEAFNITNGDAIRTRQLWSLVANYFGMEWKLGDKGFTIHGYMKNKGDTWRKIVQKYKLHDIELEKLETFQFLDQVLYREWDEISSITKVEKFGFRCHNETGKRFLRFFDSLKNMMVIPSYEPTA